MVVLAIILFAIPYSLTSDNFKSQLNKNEEAIATDNILKDKNSAKTTDKTIQTNENQTKKLESNESLLNDNKTTTHLEPNSDKPPKEVLTWKKLSEDAERYKLVLTLLGENFNKKTYNENTFSNLSADEKQLVKDLFNYTNTNNILPVDFTSTFTDFCIGTEFENMIYETQDNPFYNALSESFVISWKSDNTYYISIKKPLGDTENKKENFVTEDLPLTLNFEDNKNIVGNCSINLNKIEIINQGYKSSPDVSTYSKFIRFYATVENLSSEETYLTSKKDGQIFIGKYYGTDEIVNISWNNNYKWKVDSNVKSDFGWNLKPNESKDICVTGVFISSDILTYNDTPQIDLYFSNEGKSLTFSFNK